MVAYFGSGGAETLAARGDACRESSEGAPMRGWLSRRGSLDVFTVTARGSLCGGGFVEPVVRHGWAWGSTSPRHGA